MRSGRFLATTLALLLLLLPAAPGHAQEPAAHLVEVVEQTPWVVPGGAFALRLRVGDVPEGSQLAWSLHDRVVSRLAFQRSLEGTGLPRRRIGPVRADLAPPLLQADGTVLLVIPTGDTHPDVPPINLPREGVYPIVVDVLGPDGRGIDRLVTYLLFTGAARPEEVPLRAAVVLTLHEPPAHRGVEDVAPVAGTVAPLLESLAAHPDLALTLAATPETLAAAEQDPDLADALAALDPSVQVLAEPWVRVDPVAWQAAGLGELLAASRARGVDAVEDALGRSPDAGTALAPAGATVEDVAALASVGARQVVVAEADLAPIDEDDFPLTLTRPFRVPLGPDPTGPTLPALAADPALAAHRGSTGQPVLDAHHLLADLAVLAMDEPADARVATLVLDPAAGADTVFLDTVLDGLEPVAAAVPLDPAQPAVEPARLVEAVTVADAVASVVPAGADGGADAADPLVRPLVGAGRPGLPAGFAGALVGLATDLGSYRGVFGDDDPVAARVEDLLLTAGADELDEGGREALLATGHEALRAGLGGIVAPERARVTLTAREGHIQLLLANRTGVPADVVVELAADRLELPEYPDGRIQVRLDGETTRLDVLLRALSSGDIPLDVRLTSPDGRLELGRSRVTVRATALSGVGVALMVAAAAFLVVWWTRTILRERRTARARHPVHGAP